MKQAATERVFGFEIMPAPFVVAHLQVGLTMQDLDAPLADDGKERAGVFLTNALTGWEPRTTKPLPFPELEEERDRAERVKQETPILVILGNPPYNGFAGMAVDEERELSDAYRSTKRVRRPEGQGLNDLYVRFFRMAERRIAEKTGQGVVCFISNYSWLDGLSFTGMRERYLEAFDAIRIDCLNGDKYKTGKVAPDGSPDPSIFSTQGDPVGIQVGTAIATLVRKADHAPADKVSFRSLWGKAKRAKLLESSETEPAHAYSGIDPALPLGLPFVQMAVSECWFDWPALPDLFPVSFPGVKTSRDGFLVDIDLDRLRGRIYDFFDTALSHEEIARRYPNVMKTTARFDAHAVRETLLARGEPDGGGFIRYAYRPFDMRWLYWEAATKLLDEKRADYRPHVFEGNMWLVTQQKPRRDWSSPQAIAHIGCLDLMDRSATCIPARVRDESFGSDSVCRPNLSGKDTTLARTSRIECGGPVSPRPRGAPRFPPTARPTPGRSGWNGRASRFPAGPTARPKARRRRLRGRRRGGRRPRGPCSIPICPSRVSPNRRSAREIAAIAVPATTDGRNMAGDDFALTAGWGHYGAGDAVMPGQGRVVERAYTPDERDSLGGALPTLGPTTFDVYLNSRAYWRNVPAAVWAYKLGGYQVLKKWLSYRERSILNRPLSPEEVQHFADTARRIAAILATVTIREAPPRTIVRPMTRTR